MVVEVANEGPRLIGTNYWETEHARRGLLYLSLNAGAFRVLVPPVIERQVLAEIRTAKTLVVSRGPWPDQQRADAFELLFDDGSSSPWCAHLVVEQIDRPPADDSLNQTWIGSVWRRGADGTPECAVALPAWYRRSPRLPDLRPAPRQDVQ